MSNGEKILNEIIKQGMVKVDGATEPVVFVWSANSADQLDALVEQIVQSRLADTKKELATVIAGRRQSTDAWLHAESVMKEMHRLQLAAISTQADSNSFESVDQPLEANSQYITPALKDVNRAVHREIRRRCEAHRWRAMAIRMARELIKRGMTPREVATQFNMPRKFGRPERHEG